MLVSTRDWTDARDGQTWEVSGVWLANRMVMGPLTFTRGRVVYHRWCGVTAAGDEGLEGLLDQARKMSVAVPKTDS